MDSLARLKLLHERKTLWGSELSFSGRDTLKHFKSQPEKVRLSFEQVTESRLEAFSEFTYAMLMKGYKGHAVCMAAVGGNCSGLYVQHVQHCLDHAPDHDDKVEKLFQEAMEKKSDAVGYRHFLGCLHPS